MAEEHEKQNRIDLAPPTPAVPQLTLEELKARTPDVARGCYDSLLDVLLAFGARHAAENRLPPTMRLVCSRTTFTDYLECPLMISGPWEWTIADHIPHSYVKVSIDGHHIGTMQLHNLALAH